MLLALAIYLYDSLLMLSSNEAVLYQGWRGRWHAGFGANRWRLGFREPYLPNPLMPHRAVFRLTWHFEGAAVCAPSSRLLLIQDQLRTLAPFIWAAGFSLFALLPLGLFTRLGSPFALGAIALVYGNIVAALILLLLKRSQIGLSKKEFFWMAFECLACAPIALNLIRRLALKEPVKEDFTQAAQRLLKPLELSQAHAACLERINEQMDYEPEDSARMAALKISGLRFSQETQP